MYQPLEEEPSDDECERRESEPVAKRTKLDELEDSTVQEVDSVSGRRDDGQQREEENKALLVADEVGDAQQQSDSAIGIPSEVVLEGGEDELYEGTGGVSSADEGVDGEDDEALLVKPVDQTEGKSKLVKANVVTRLVRWSLVTLVCCAIPIFVLAACVIIGLHHSCVLLSPLPWWKTAVIYQIYPQSFQDTSGNGTGDLRGIIQRVDYLEYLGVKAVWLNPIYPSPLADAGYDVSNYTGINPLYGSLDDFHELLHALHKKEIKLIMDFVPNHTSEEYPWFKESRSSLTSPKRDWYVWADPAKDGTPPNNPPNNWISIFGGSMWEYDNTTDQYYLHQFSKQQPDLNMRNPEVLDALDKVLCFWLDAGVDGFRVDAVQHLLEDSQLRDEPPASADESSPTYNSLDHIYTKNVVGVHNITKRWRKVVDKYKDRVFIGEIYDSPEVVMSYYGTENAPEFHYPFNFALLENTNWTGTAVSEIIDSWMKSPPRPQWGWPNWVLGNHDNPRIASKAGPELARALNVLLLLLPGTPTTYYGEELGLENVPVPKELQQDTNTDHPRDGERTPMLWNNTANAGFSSGNWTWLPVANKSVVEKFNVEAQKADDRSMLQLYRKLVQLRDSPAFTNDGYHEVAATNDTLVFLRYYKDGVKLSDDRFAVVINFSSKSTTVSVDVDDFVGTATLVLSSQLDDSGTTIATKSVPLRPYEAVVLRGQSEYWI